MEQGQPEIQPAILSEPVKINGAVLPLTLTGDGKLLWSDEGQRVLTLEEEALGFDVEVSRIRVKTVGEGGGRICCVVSKGHLVRKSFVFEPLSEDSLRLWCQKLRQYFDSLGRPKKLFIFMNPFGGKRSAPKIFLEDVKPFLDDADVQYTVLDTKYQLHAKEVAKTLDLSASDGIVCVSGDGILVEVVNGFLEREDWEDAIRMPIGMIPAGTGNGMVKSLLDAVGQPCAASNAIFAIIRGHKRKLDVATMMQGETMFFSVLMLAWGFIADIDIESEKYRWMGSARIDFYALQRILHLRRYSGRISFVAAPGFESYGEPASYSELNQSEQQTSKFQQVGYQGPNVELDKLDWRTINGPFVSIWLHNVPWGGEDALAAPDAKFSDGYLDLILFKDCPKLVLLSVMSEVNKGTHVNSPHVLYLKVKAFILEPGARVDDPTKEGIIDVDGEVIASGKGTYKSDQKTLMTYNKLQIVMDQGLATVFSPI